MSDEITITYEVLFELVMREKSREELQKLPEEFSSEVIAYYNKKKALSLTQDDPQREMTERQASNALRLLKELYERREKKIVHSALVKVRVGTAIIDYNAMLDEERALFDGLLTLLKTHRADILESRLQKTRRVVVTQGNQQMAEENEPAHEETAPSEDAPTKLVRFLNPVPKFVGKELEVYGPFEQDEMANLPEDIADVLINKGRAEEVSGE